MSKRSRIPLGKLSAAERVNDTPDAPGPPGLIRSDPIRRLGSRAGMRTRERPIVRLSGCSSSSGTVSVANWALPQARHWRVPVDALVDAPVDSAVVAAPASGAGSVAP